MSNLVGQVHNGYTIIKQGKIAVLGKSSRVDSFGQTINQFVTWHYRFDRNNQLDLYWGRYGFNLRDILKRFHRKERGEYSGD